MHAMTIDAGGNILVTIIHQGMTMHAVQIFVINAGVTL